MDQIQQLISQHINIWTSADSEKKSRRGRSGSNAEKVYGIEKLRELILNLAIHGNLVPQYTNDEPASELLKRIESEQIKLLKGKKQKPLQSISNEETSFKLPRGWSWVRNSQLFQLRKGKIPKNLNENGMGLPYLDIEALDRNVIRRYSEDSNCPTSQETDILVVCDGSRSGLILNGKYGIIGSTLSIIDTPIFIQPFIKLIFKKGFKDFNTTMKGAAIPHLDIQKLLQNITALPPLQEQQRIVSKVDDLMALCDQLEQQHINSEEAHDKLVKVLLDSLVQSKDVEEFKDNWQRITNHFDILFTTEDSVDQLKQILLQLAVMGKLVPQDPNDEPANKLLERIRAEKAKLINEGKIRKIRALGDITNNNKPFEIPKSWQWTHIEIVGHDWGQKIPDNEFTYIEVSAIDASRGIIFKPEKTSAENAPSRARKIVKKGTVIYSTVRPYLLNIAEIEENFSPEPIASTAFAVVHPHCNMPANYFLSYFRSPTFVNYVESVQMGIAYPAINDSHFYNGLIPLPPIQEQKRIVSKLKELITLCDELKSRIQEASNKQKQIADVLVSQALH